MHSNFHTRRMAVEQPFHIIIDDVARSHVFFLFVFFFCELVLVSQHILPTLSISLSHTHAASVNINIPKKWKKQRNKKKTKMRTRYYTVFMFVLRRLKSKANVRRCMCVWNRTSGIVDYVVVIVVVHVYCCKA